MNRRNFLKLLGIVAVVPTSAHAMRGVKVPPSFQQMRARKKKPEVNLYITLEKHFGKVHGKHRVIKSIKRGEKYHIIDYGEWSDTYEVHGICVSADMMITVETQNGIAVSFTPIANPYQEGKFEAVNVTTRHNCGWVQTYELVAVAIR